MKKIISIVIIYMLMFTGIVGCGQAADGIEQSFFEKKHKQYQATYFDLFDTVTTVVGYAKTEEEFKEVSSEIYGQLKHYHGLFDIYHEYEEANLKTINDQAAISPVEVDGEIIELLEDCRRYYELTGGSVNAAMGSVLSLWHEARVIAMEEAGKAELPSEDALAEAVKHIGFENVVINTELSTVFLKDNKMSLDVGAIAKGWAVERVSKNIPEGYLISVGGNVRVTGPKPDGSPWIIGIQDPTDSSSYIEKVSISCGSVVTSGDYQRYVEVNGKKYHHLIDVATGYPAEFWKSVTVVCEDSGMADALSTALFVLKKEEGKKILEQFDAEAMWVDLDGKIDFGDKFKEYFIR